MSKIEIFEGQRANQYDNIIETWMPGYQFFMGLLPDILTSVKHRTLLVAGCGTGNEIAYLTRTGKPWAVTGVDPSPEMIAQARRKFNSKPTVKLIGGSVADLSISEKFGAATLLLVLHFIPDNGDKLNLLEDIVDRLETGGPLVLLDITGTPNELRATTEVLRTLLPAGADPEIVDYRLKRMREELHTVSEERLSELCQQAGLTPPTRFFQSTAYRGFICYKRR